MTTRITVIHSRKAVVAAHQCLLCFKIVNWCHHDKTAQLRPRLDWEGLVTSQRLLVEGTDNSNRCDGTCPDIWTIRRVENLRCALYTFKIFIGKSN